MLGKIVGVIKKPYQVLKQGYETVALIVKLRSMWARIKELKMRKFWMTLAAQVLGTVVLFTASYFGLPEDSSAQLLDYLLTVLGIGTAGNVIEHVKNGIVEARTAKAPGA